MDRLLIALVISAAVTVAMGLLAALGVIEDGWAWSRADHVPEALNRGDRFFVLATAAGALSTATLAAMRLL